MLDAIQFSSFAEFIDMGGYAFNVWSVYALFAIFIAINLILPLRKKQKIISQLKRRMLLDAEIQGEDAGTGE
jgi:heme exporter protein D